MYKTLFRLLAYFILLAIGIVLSYFFLDRQIVWFLVGQHSRQYTLLSVFANDITLTISVAMFLYYLYFVIKLVMTGVSIFDKKLITACNAVVITLFLKDILKNIFGRYWTATFVCNNPSLVSDHVYGFNWFKSGSAFTAFPSGHTAFIFAFSAAMWFEFPKLRWLWGLLALLVAFSQVGLYYHFLSDVMAGAALGSFVGFYTAKYSKVKDRR